MYKIKRIYDDPEKDDGFRILVDRVWPRGLSKEDAKTDLWLKEIAPSSGLRKWFSHDPDKFEDFKKKYKDELKDNREEVDKIINKAKEEETVTLLYSAKDKEHNNAVVLKDFLDE